MKLGALYNLLIAWCLLVLAPGFVALGIPATITRNSVPGSLIILWLVGYLAQFGIFMWMMNIVGKQKIVWWFMASLLPWAVDWTPSVSPWFILLWLPITVATALWIAQVARRTELLQQHGIRAIGVVLEVFKPWMNVVVNNVYIRRKMRIRIEREDGMPAYEAILKGLFMLGEVPSPGDRIRLLVDPANPQRFEYENETVPASAPLAQAASASVTDRANIADELEKLANLHERGVLTASEFEAAKKKLLRS
jgi:putative oligomerization/nucleic acid binding protein